MEAKKKLLTYAGLKALEEELENLKVVKRKEVAAKIKEASISEGLCIPLIPVIYDSLQNTYPVKLQYQILLHFLLPEY